jgi:hypothetical protein
MWCGDQNEVRVESSALRSRVEAQSEALKAREHAVQALERQLNEQKMTTLRAGVSVAKYHFANHKSVPLSLHLRPVQQ